MCVGFLGLGDLVVCRWFLVGGFWVVAFGVIVF